MMLSIYIVDDEAMAIEYFEKLLQECKTKCILVGVATNSQFALDDILKHQPDVVFVDVNMPGITGIELAEALLKKIPHIKIIFLTAYRDFDYVKKGMEMGIASYILKNELSSAILDEELQMIGNEIRKEKEFKYLTADKCLRKYFLRSNDAIPKIENLRPQEKLQMVYITTKRSYSMHRIQDLEREIDYDDFIRYQEEKGDHLLAFSRIQSNVWTPVWGISKETDRNKLLTHLQVYISKLDFECLLVIPQPAPDYAGLKRYFEKAKAIDDRRLDFYDCSRLSLEDLDMLIEEKKHLGIYEKNLKYALESNSRDLEHQALIDALNVYSNYTNDSRFIKYAQMIFDDYCVQMKNAYFIEEIPREWDYKEFYSKVEWKQWMLGIIKEYHQMKEKNLRKGYSKKVTEILNLIEQHYMDNSLGPQFLAERLKISNGYLRKMFKEEMGITLAEYILQFRINKAKKLLKDPSVKVSEIYKQIGFSSSQYLSTVFKKKTGMSPKEYTQKYMKY